MTANSSSERFRPTASDLILVVLAILGFGSYLILLPDLHPDVAAHYGMRNEQIIDRANSFLAQQGYSTDNLEISASLKRNTPLLEAMQQDLGRERTIDILLSDETTALPGHYWSVVYSRSGPDDSEQSILDEPVAVFAVNLTLGGAPWAFSNTSATAGPGSSLFGSVRRVVNKAALARVFSPHDSLLTDTINRLRNVPDSLILAGLRFVPLNQPGFEEASFLDPSVPPLEALENGYPALLDSTAIIALSRFFAPRYLLDKATWKVDSLRVLGGNMGRIAETRFLSADPVHGQEIRVQMTVSSTGSLLQMNVVFNPGRSSDNFSRDVRSAIMIGAYVLLAIILMIVFFRRIMARLIDVKSAMLDALLFGLLLGLWATLSRDINIVAGSALWVQIGVRLLMFSIVAGAAALFTFIISAVSESMVREVWPEKLLSLTLARRGDFQNTIAGASILRGISIAGVLLGIGILALVAFPTLGIKGDENLLSDISYRPFLQIVAGSAGLIFLTVLMVLVGIGTFASRLGGRNWLIVICISICGGVFQLSPFSLAGGWIPIGISVTVALVLALAFIRYDIITVFTGLFFANVIWSLNEGFLIGESPARLDSLLLLLFVLAAVVLGFVGVFSKRTGDHVETYVPEYLTEIASQERIKRELEIAHQVQASFLPRTMPHIEGLDLAGMCLPASEVGGDYFDFIKLSDERVAFVVGDVSGKGIQAAFYMTFVKGVIQTLSRSVDSPAEVMRLLNGLFRQNAPAGTFISMIYGVVDVSSGTFTFARAGHNPAILMRASMDEAEPLRPKGMAIGMTGGEVFDANIDEVFIEMRAGDSLVFYTDGFSEAMNSARDLYGDERLTKKVGQVGHRSAGAILRSLTEDVHHFIEGTGRSDDMTMVVIKMLSQS